MGERVEEEGAKISTRIILTKLAGVPAQKILRDRSRRQLDDRRRAQGPSDFRARLGRFDPWKYLRGALRHRSNHRDSYCSLRNRIHDRARRMVSARFARFV